MEFSGVTLKDAHPIKIIDWTHEPFLLNQSERNFYYQLQTGQPDIFDGFFHLTVRTIMTFHCASREVFHAETDSLFEIGYRHDAPSPEFLFDLIRQATIEFAKIFNKKVQGTNLTCYPVPIPDIEFLRGSLQNVIDYWDAPVRKFKESGGERLDRFKGLPTIPQQKQYNGSKVTTEQIVLRKLEKQQPITFEERRILEELTVFYEELNSHLLKLEYNLFNEQDIFDFRNYIRYVFNAFALLSNKATITGDLFRVVVNEWVTGHNIPIADTKFLTYPPLDVVKKKGRFNRASTPNTTLLYLTETLDTALKEIRPPVNKLVTVSVWAPKNRKEFVHFPIEHSEEAAKVNSEVAKGIAAIEQLNQTQDPMLTGFMRNYFNLLAREYSKSVLSENHYEYMLSAVLSEEIFAYETGNVDFNYECITYPSVGNNFFTRNLAIKPSIADSEFKIVQVKEFEIEETYYERAPVPSLSTECISIVKVKNYRETFDITEDGQVKWSGD